MIDHSMNSSTRPASEKTVVVIGMHRSGSSLTSGILEALGVNMGEKLMAESQANPVGYFEDKAFLRLNRKILNAAGGTWYDPPSPEAVRAQAEAFRSEVEALVQDKPLRWGWKDPRTSLTLEVYLDQLTDPHLVVTHRDPEAIAASLVKRGDMQYEEAIALTALYEKRIQALLEARPELPRLHASYETLTRHPHRWTKEAIRFLDLKPTPEQREQALSLVLSKRSIQWLRAKRLLTEAFRRPLDVPQYVFRRLRQRSNSKLETR